MKNLAFLPILLVFTIIFSSGCTGEMPGQVLEENAIEINEGAMYENEHAVEVVEQDETVETPQTHDELDISNFMRYTWVPDVPREGVGSNFFRLYDISEGIINGSFGMRLTPPVFRDSRYDFSDFADDVPLRNNMQLELQGKVAEGHYEIEGKINHIKLEFTEDEFIKVTSGQDKETVFRQLNISDLGGLVVMDSLSFPIDLNSWGEVYLVSGYYEPGRVMHLPNILLTCSKGNILYSFGAEYQVGSIPYEIIIDDLNGDGLLDVHVITTSDVYDGEYSHLIFHFNWYFYQLKNGWFFLVPGEMPE